MKKEIIMTVLLQFDLFYTIVRIPDRFKNISVLRDEFLSWVNNNENCREYSDDNSFVTVYDDKAFIDWIKEYKLNPDETIEIIKSQVTNKARQKGQVDETISF